MSIAPAARPTSFVTLFKVRSFEPGLNLPIKNIAMFSMQTSLKHRRYFIYFIIFSQNISKNAECHLSNHLKNTKTYNSDILYYCPTWHLKFTYKYVKFKYVML